MTIKSRVLADPVWGRESEPERMSGRERGRVGGITRGVEGGGILAKVFVSAAIFSLAHVRHWLPNLGCQDNGSNPHLPTLRVNEGEKEKEGGREGGRSLSYYGKSGCSSCTLPDLKVLSGAGASFCEAAGIYSCWHLIKKTQRGDREGERQQRGFGMCPFCSVKDYEMFSALFTRYSSAV